MNGVGDVSELARTTSRPQSMDPSGALSFVPIVSSEPRQEPPDWRPSEPRKQSKTSALGKRQKVEESPTREEVEGEEEEKDSESPPEPTEATVNIRMLECPICIDVLCEPVSISACGHSFCRLCLVTAQKLTRKKCPVCRAVCHVNAMAQKENQVIACLAKSLFPSAYARRRRLLAKEKEKWKNEHPIFFYNDTLFPGSQLNLFLFEPRYKLMMKRIIQGSRRFAYLPNFSDYTPSVGDIGLIADVTECEFLHDGRAIMQAQCNDRFRIIEHWCEDGTQGLYGCSVETVEDEPLDENQQREMEAEVKRGRAFVDKILKRASPAFVSRYGPLPTLSTSAEKLGWWLAKACVCNENLRYALFCSTNSLQRFKTVNEIWGQMLQEADVRQEQQQSIAQGAQEQPHALPQQV